MSLLISRTTAQCHQRRASRVGFSKLLGQLAGLMRSRCTLEHLSEHQLRDVGLTRDQAQQEAKRPIWDVPANWVD